MKSVSGMLLILAAAVAVTVTAGRADVSTAADGNSGGGPCASIDNSTGVTYYWNISCGVYHMNMYSEGLNEPCWTPNGVPGPNDTVIFPTAAYVTTSDSTYMYAPLVVKNFVVQTGATIEMHGAGFQVTTCMLVQGQLLMDNDDYMATSSIPFLIPDPTAPGSQSCQEQSGGFTPRICGPGTLRVEGLVQVLQGYYAAFFVSMYVTNDGIVILASGSFLFGNTTNYGLLEGRGETYLGGYLFNYRTVLVENLEVATIFGEGRPLIENHGTMDATLSQQGTFVSDSDSGLFINSGVLNLRQGSVLNLHLANLPGGSIHFDCNQLPPYQSYCNAAVSGTTVNSGTITSSATDVQFSKYDDANGQLVTTNGGVFYVGAGSAHVDPKATRMCTEPPKPTPEEELERKKRLGTELTCSDTILCSEGQCCVNGKCEIAECNVVCCPNNAGCTLYHEAYCGGYFEFVRSQPCDRQLVVKRLGEGGQRLLHSHPKVFGKWKAATTDSHVIAGRMVVSGDGTGTVIFVRPTRVEGSVVVLEGGSFYAMVEREQPALYGAGSLVVQRGGIATLGIASVFDEQFEIRVKAGGSVHVPRWSRVVFSNATMLVERDAVLHVDGSLLFQPAHKGAKLLSQCGTLRGRGTVGAPHDMEC